MSAIATRFQWNDLVCSAEMAFNPAASQPTLVPGEHLLLLADPVDADAQADATRCTLAHVDPSTERLIVEAPAPTDKDQELESETGRFVFVLVVQPGVAYFARAFRIENVQRPPGADAAHHWLVLRPSGRWQRIDRRRSERASVPALSVTGRRYPLTGGVLRFDGELRDISEGGVLLSSAQRLQLNEVLEFDLPIEPSFRVRVRALRVQLAQAETSTWLIGGSFEGLSLQEGARVREYVALHQAA